MINFIDDEKTHFGVESICRILPIAPSTYYRIKDEQENPEKQSRRKQSDKHLMAQIKQIWQASGCRYGIRKVWHKLKQDGMPKLGRCTVKQLMKQMAYEGYGEAKAKSPPDSVMTKTNPLIWSNATLPQIAQTRKDSCGAVLLRSQILPTLKLNQVGSILPL